MRLTAEALSEFVGPVLLVSVAGQEIQAPRSPAVLQKKILQNDTADELTTSNHSDVILLTFLIAVAAVAILFCYFAEFLFVAESLDHETLNAWCRISTLPGIGSCFRFLACMTPKIYEVVSIPLSAYLLALKGLQFTGPLNFHSLTRGRQELAGRVRPAKSELEFIGSLLINGYMTGTQTVTFQNLGPSQTK